MQAIRHQRAGDSKKAMAAMEAIAADWYENGDHLFCAYLEEHDGTQNVDEYVDEYIAENEKLSLGLADNEAFWSWIARHSPLVRESNAWFKRETLEELVAEVQDEQGNNGEESARGEALAKTDEGGVRRRRKGKQGCGQGLMPW